jgi:hypothetical protein
VTEHPVRPADRWVSLRMQAGNADDVLMRRLHGPRWRELAEVGRGRRRRHLAVTAAGAAAALLLATGRRPAALLAGAGWAAGVGEFAAARIRPGPRSRDEVLTMAATSVLLPPLATYHWLRGLVRHRHVGPAVPDGWAGHPEPSRLNGSSSRTDRMDGPFIRNARGGAGAGRG